MPSLVELFCHVDDFCQQFEPLWAVQQLGSGKRHRRRKRSLSLSEVMTILIHFHQSHYRNFKAYYLKHVRVYLRAEFPGLVSYKRFVDYIPGSLIPMAVYLKTSCVGECTGISYIDSTPIAVCDNRRINRHKVMAADATRGKTSMGWFYGFKLHFVCNDQGEILDLHITAGHVDDRQPVVHLAKKLFGKLFGDRGYISKKLTATLANEQGVTLITTIRKNMKGRLMPWMDAILLRRRSIIETVIDQLKNISQIEHSRHRSPTNFIVNLLAGIIAYCHQPKKPGLGIRSAGLLAP